MSWKTGSRRAWLFASKLNSKHGGGEARKDMLAKQRLAAGGETRYERTPCHTAGQNRHPASSIKLVRKNAGRGERASQGPVSWNGSEDDRGSRWHSGKERQV